jgi:hypothetical protein
LIKLYFALSNIEVSEKYFIENTRAYPTRHSRDRI